MLPEDTIKELCDLRSMAKAVVEMVDRLVEVKEKKKVSKVEADFERFRLKRMARRLSKSNQ